MHQETLTLSQAQMLISTLSEEQSVLLLSPPGVGKSAAVAQAALSAGLELRSLLGTQIAPEDVSGVPRIIDERSVFCPPRVLLPNDPKPFCLFLDELPATAPDVQKALYSLLLERRLGEFALPKGTWVVAAGNRLEDRALVRAMSSALINRVTIVNIRVDLKEWLQWAKKNGVRKEIIAFIVFMPDALMRSVPNAPVPFSTPRAWAALSRAFDLVEARGELTPALRRALAFGRLSASDAAVFCAMEERSIDGLLDPVAYVSAPEKLPHDDIVRWFILSRLRVLVERGALKGLSADVINKFLLALPREHRFGLLVDLVETWGALGANPALRESLREVTGL